MLNSANVDPVLVDRVLKNPPPYGDLAAEALCKEGFETLKGRLLWKFLQFAGTDQRSLEFRLLFNQIAPLIGKDPKLVDSSKAAAYKPVLKKPEELAARTPFGDKPALQLLRSKAREVLAENLHREAQRSLGESERVFLQNFLNMPPFDLRSTEGRKLVTIIRPILGMTPYRKPGPVQESKTKVDPVPSTATEFILKYPDIPASELVKWGALHGIHFVQNTVYYARGCNGQDSSLRRNRREVS